MDLIGKDESPLEVKRRRLVQLVTESNSEWSEMVRKDDKSAVATAEASVKMVVIAAISNTPERNRGRFFFVCV